MLPLWGVGEERNRALYVPPPIKAFSSDVPFEVTQEMFIEHLQCEAETPIFWPPDVKNWLIWKDPDSGKDWRQKKGTTEDEMVGWHPRL